jgi:hypothetical protein
MVPPKKYFRELLEMRLVQLQGTDGGRTVATLANDANGREIQGVTSSYELASRAIAENLSLEAMVAKLGLGESVDVRAALATGRVLAPLDHPDPAHLVVTGTGLTHLGSAEGRDAMHKKLSGGEPVLTDSMKMFKLGLESGKPAAGQEGAQPEWFYKGDGGSVVAPESAFASPAFAQDGGEEPEIVGLYLIGPDSTPHRLGFALGNEFSDHITEKFNYLWLAHSKLRQCSFGPELRTGALPAAVTGSSRVRRGNEIIFDKPFLSGEDNMSHTIANLEAHHFKYSGFRRPGDVHVHFFGTATLSFSAGIKTEPGDVFEIEADAFVFPLRNALSIAPAAPFLVAAL